MAKKSRVRSAPVSDAVPAPAAAGAVGPRQPCPCGSGKRYKACHGAPGAAGTAYVARPFEGLPSECDIVAMRELVPAATAPLSVTGDDGGSAEQAPVVLCSLLPVAAPAMRRESGQVWLGLQVQHHYGDPSRDLAAVLQLALAAEAPGIIGLPDGPGAGPRLQDLIADERLEITVHDGFDFWLADVDDTAGMSEALEEANATVIPTARLTQAEAAYWCDVGTKEHLRWVLPEAEDDLLDALARLHAAGDDALVDGSRLVGMFRAQGLLAPVWDLAVGTGAEALEDPAAAFRVRLDQALADTSDLTSAQRSARSGLANRQVTIR